MAGFDGWPVITDDDGSTQVGTIVNKALFDLIKAELEDKLFSATNPSEILADIIDEIVEARGNKATLDARLSVSIDDDGNLLIPASLASLSDIYTLIGARNQVLNDDLATWSAGAAAAPDNFTLSGAGAAVARTGSGEADTYSSGTGQYNAKITYGAASAKLSQDIISAADFSKYGNVKGRKFSIGCRIKASVASMARIVVDDGVTQTASSFHAGDGVDRWTSVTHVISNSATKLTFYVEVAQAGSAYFGGFTGVFSNLAPSDWSPFASLQDASATVRGVVSIVAQTFAGVKTFNSPPLGVVRYARQTADVIKNASTAFSDLTGASLSIPANETHVFLFFSKAGASVAADLKYTFTGPAAPTAVLIGALGGQASPIAPTATALGTGVALAAGGVGTPEACIIFLIIRNGANSGTIQVQGAQNTSDATNTTFYTESALIGVRVA